MISMHESSQEDDEEIEELFHKPKRDKDRAEELPGTEDVDEEYDGGVGIYKPIRNHIEELAKAQEIDLGTGWKVRLASMVKKEILKGTDKVIGEDDPEFAKVLELFNRF